MNQQYLQLVTFLKDVNDNLDGFLKGETRPFPDVNIKHDVLFQALTDESESDAHCIVILGGMLASLAKLTKKLYADQLHRRRGQRSKERLNPIIDFGCAILFSHQKSETKVKQ